MKSVVLLLLCLTIISCKSHLKKHQHHSKGPIEFDAPPNVSTIITVENPQTPVKTIPFGKPATTINEGINSVGEIVSENVALNSFPFTITRCDQIVLFPCTYINDEDDYRVRRKGFAVVTAHYTNLFADEDGQKLIQQVISSTAKGEPHNLKGARGCVRVPGDNFQKNLNICTPSMNTAKNLLEVYEQFARCRYGDNLAPIPAEMLQELLKMCDINRVTISGPGAARAMDKLSEEIDNRNNRLLDQYQDKVHGINRKKGDDANGKMTEAMKKRLLKKFLLKHKKQPEEFFLPTLRDNPWEEDRRKYVQYHRVKVPGSRRRRRY